jgi:hypothetical protein
MNIDQISKKYYLSGIVDRFEGRLAIIRTDDGQEIKWPISNLPEDAEAGAAIRLSLVISKSDQEEKENLAKKMLNEILKPKKI